MWTKIACIRVNPVVNELPGDKIWLIIRSDVGEKSVKYQLSNAPLDTNTKRFAQMSYSRFWIERAFEDGKGIAGLVRLSSSWLDWMASPYDIIFTCHACSIDADHRSW